MYAVRERGLWANHMPPPGNEIDPERFCPYDERTPPLKAVFFQWDADE
jgi:hypothetical protein